MNMNACTPYAQMASLISAVGMYVRPHLSRILSAVDVNLSFDGGLLGSVCVYQKIVVLWWCGLVVIVS